MNAQRGRLISTRLGRLYRARLGFDIAALLVVLLALLVGIGALVALLFWSGWLLLGAVVLVAVVAWRWLSRDRLAPVVTEVEETFPAVRGRLRAALELCRYDEKSREGYSVELLDAAVAQAEQALSPLPLGRLDHRGRLFWAGAGLVAVVAIVGLLGLFLFERMQLGFLNGFAPSRVPVSLLVAPGDTAVMPNGTAVLRCRLTTRRESTSRGLPLRAVWLETRSDGAGRQTLRRRRLRLVGDSCVARVPAEKGFWYRFRALSAVSAERRVRVLEPLGITWLVFGYNYPPYTGLAPVRSSNPDISVLRGTVVEFEGEADRAIGQAQLVLGSETLGIEIDKAVPSRFRGRFVAKSDASGGIELAGIDDGPARPAVGLRVRVLGDEPPFVRLFLPGRDVDLPASMQIPLGINAIDDFGLGELVLHFAKEIQGLTRAESSGQRIRIRNLGGRREDTTFYVWDLADVGLLPGEVMRYYVTVSDNDGVRGPKSSRSEVNRVRFPTLAEIHSAAVRQTERTTEELGPMQTEQEQLSADLARIADELKRNRELGWPEKQALARTLDGQQELLNQIADLQAEIQQFKEELSQGLSFDRETMNRLGQLQELLSQMLPRELQQSLARLRDQLEQQSPEIRQALERFQLDQEKLRAGIERALELLRRIAEEQRLAELARKAAELAQRQDELASRLDREPKEAAAARQQDIKAGLDSLLGQMKRLADSLSDRDLAQALGQLAEAAEGQQLSARAQRIAEQLQQGQTKPAQGPSRELAEELAELGQGLQSLSDRLKQKRSQDVARKLTAAAGDILMLSRQQEALETSLAPKPDLGELAPTQMGIHDATRIVAESLASLAGQTLSIPPQAGPELARAMHTMQQAAQALVENRGGSAGQLMAGARQGLNRVALSLLEAAANAEQGGGLSGGMEDLLEQLSQMASGQMGINSEMGGMPIPLPGGLSEAQMQALARILAKQSAIRQQLEQMLQSMGGDRPGLTSALDGVLEEMRQVERDLAELNVTRELVERQESILSHLLDAQRSIRQQGFKEERESETGRPFEIRERPRLPVDAGERNRLLREELMRALKQGYPTEYEEMIRAYFDRLLNE